MFTAFPVKDCLSIASFIWQGSEKRNTECNLDYSPPKKDQLPSLLTAKCQTCYQSLAECEVSQLFDVLNMKSDHRTKQLSATSTCQKQSTPIIIEFLSWMHLLCRHWGVLQYCSVNKDFRQFSKINIIGFTCLHQKAAADRLQIQSKTHILSGSLWEKVKWFAASQSEVLVPNIVLWPREYDFNFVKGSPH